ncbi:MAG: 4-phosphoerythronate dehydrogenase, partial [Bacteroidales bacterium]|nr:4-phosphoerythronate dehydrogenase [Bacteroidales bacterium]
MKIVIDSNIPYIKNILEPYAEVKYLPGKEMTNAEIKDADALVIRTRTRCNEELLRNSCVKIIASATIGHDHIDTEYCKSNNIKWVTAKGCNSGSVYHYVISALFYLEKELNINLNDIKLGVVGAGNIGGKVANFANVTGIKCLINDPPRERIEKNTNFTDLETVLKESDIITIHTPLNLTGPDKTFHLINKSSLTLMKPGACLINTARGEIINTKDLLAAVSDGKAINTIIDVWENEPEVSRELVNSSILSTPHIAGYSADGKARATELSVNEISSYFNLPLNNWKVDCIPQLDFNEFTISDMPNDILEILRLILPKTYP